MVVVVVVVVAVVVIGVNGRYMTNLLNNPDDAKFKRIRVGNKVFQDRVAVMMGALNFLHAIGFDSLTGPWWVVLFVVLSVWL